MIAQAIFVFSILLTLWSIGGLIWVTHLRSIVTKKIFDPWSEALEREDVEACRYWAEQSRRFIKLYPLKYPPSWIANWNWEPEPRKKETP